MGVYRFEDLEVWKRAFRLNELLRPAVGRARGGSDVELADQVASASLSVVANIAEGFGRGRRREFAQFVRVAQGSAAETRALVHVLSVRGYVKQPELTDIQAHLDAVGRMLRRLIQALDQPGSR
jgi:four helix bundle protein